MTAYIKPFNGAEFAEASRAIRKLAVSLQGRKLEEGDWTDLYCKIKKVPSPGWSNLPFRDYIHRGVGVEFKLLLRRNPIGDVGRSLMHPSATRTIAFDENDTAENAKTAVLAQWAARIAQFEERIRQSSTTGKVDPRWGVLLWSPDHTQFLYFEEQLSRPDPADYEGRWHNGKHRGKPTRNLHIYEKSTGLKKFSCTLPRNGAKLQPYFVVPTVKEGAAFFQIEKSDLLPLYVSRALRERLSSEFPDLTDDEVLQELLAAYHRERT